MSINIKVMPGPGDEYTSTKYFFRDFLVRIRTRIRILKAVTLTNGSVCGTGRSKNIPAADSEQWYNYIILQR